MKRKSGSSSPTTPSSESLGSSCKVCGGAVEGKFQTCAPYKAPAPVRCRRCSVLVARTRESGAPPRYCVPCRGLALREYDKLYKRKLRARAAAWAPTPEISGAV